MTEKWEITPTGRRILKKAHKLFPIVKDAIERDSWLSFVNKISGSITDRPRPKNRTTKSP